jgi:hypothetical protein
MAKALKKKKANLQARQADYDKTISANPQLARSYKRPGSMNLKKGL